MAAKIILGIDPGGRHTGAVICRGDVLLAHDVIVGDGRVDPKDPINSDYLLEVQSRLFALIHSDEVGGVIDAVAIEQLKSPSPHLGLTQVAGALACAANIGAVFTWVATLYGAPMPVVLIDTGHHGQSDVRHYPHQLVGPRETKGEGILRHARSAYDVALAARFYVRVAEAEKGPGH